MIVALHRKRETRMEAHMGIIPNWFRITYTLFMLMFIPVYWWKYGPANFVYFCDISLFIAWVGILLYSNQTVSEGRFLISMAAVGITIPQSLWLADFLGQLAGFRSGSGLADFMFGDSEAWLRAISLYHAAIPIVLVWLLKITGYDRRALMWWCLVVAVAILVSYNYLPGIVPSANAYTVCNVNFAYGFSCAKQQQYIHPHAWLVAVFIAMSGIAAVTHLWFVVRKY